MVPEKIRELARKFLNGTATEEEVNQLHQWYDNWSDDETIVQSFSESEADREARMLVRLQQQIRRRATPQAEVIAMPKRRWWKMAVAAAAILIAVAAGIYLWQQPTRNTPLTTADLQDTTSKIRPGTDKALLTTADGQQVVLDSNATGIVSKQGHTTIINSKGKLTYNGDEHLKEGNIYYNTVSTGRGNQYQVILPDGSIVRLNAASSLRFPANFTGSERVVELTGEAWFEVAKDKSRPFKVQLSPVPGRSTTPAIEVLGTHFNVMAYPDEESIRTTLVEGRVKVVNQQEAILQPGEQAIISNNDAASSSKIQVTKADIEETIAWKNGYFSYTDAPLTTVMRQAARWYNIEVEYNGNIQQEVFSGSIPRSASITQLIKILELTKTVKFNIEGRKLIATHF